MEFLADAGPEFYLNLIRTGFHGAAVAVLLLGWFLLRNACKLQEDEYKSANAPEFFRRKISSINLFLGLSLIFFVCGASLELVRIWLTNEHQVRAGEQLHRVNVFISGIPDEKSGLPVHIGLVAKSDGENQEHFPLLKGRQILDLNVRNKDTILIDVQGIETLEDYYEEQRRKKETERIFNQVTSASTVRPNAAPPGRPDLKPDDDL